MATITQLTFRISSSYDGGAVDRARASIAELNRDLDRFNNRTVSATANVEVHTAGLDAARVSLERFGAMRVTAHADINVDRAHSGLTTVARDAGTAASALGGIGSAAGGAGSAMGGLGSATSGASSGFGSMTTVIGYTLLAFAGFIALAPLIAASIVLIPLAFIAAAFVLVTTLKKANKDLYKSFTDTFHAIATTALPLVMPLIKALLQALADVRDWLKLLGPAIHDAFSAAAPLVKPLLDILLKLVGGALPGFTVAMRNMGPLIAGIGAGALLFGQALGQAAVMMSRIPGLGQIMTQIMGALGQVLIAVAQAIVQIVAVDHGQFLIQLLQALAVWIKVLLPVAQALAFSFIGLAVIMRGVGDALIALGQLFKGTGPIVTAFGVAWNATWNGIRTIAIAVWNALRVAWQAFMSGLLTAWNAFSGALHTASTATWNAFRTAAQAVWNAMVTAWRGFFSVMSSVYGTFSSALKGAWNTLWNTIKNTAQTVWNAMVSGWRGFFSVMSSVYGTFSSALKGAWSTMWNTIKSTAQTIWTAMQTGFKAFSTGVQATLSGLVTAAKKIWDGIKAVFSVPIKAVAVIWNVVAGVVGLGKIDTSKFAAGGHVQGPGGPTDDAIPAMLSAGEFVMNAAAVDHYGVDNMYAMNARKLAGGGMANGPAVPGYALGGIIPNPISVITNAIKAVFSTAADVVGFLKNNIGSAISATGGLVGTVLADKLKGIAGTIVYDVSKPIMDAIISKVPDPIPGVAKPAGSLPHAALKKLEESALAKLKTAQQLAIVSQAVGPIPAGAHKAIIDQALAAAHIPPPGSLAQWEAGVNTIINRESSWNPNAINRTDSNAAAGHPSQGLMQTIPSTFAAYHVAGTSNNILDPVANIAAACRYIVARYGNISNVQQANPNLPPKGYRHGTDRAGKGWHMVDEDGGEWINFRGGEKVLPHGRKPRSGDHGEPVQVHVENHWHGNPTKEAVQYAEGGMAESLRQACHAGVGGRSH